MMLKSRRRANETKDNGLLPKIEFLAFPLMNKIGKLGRITQSWINVLQWKPSEHRMGQKWAEGERSEFLEHSTAPYA